MLAVRLDLGSATSGAGSAVQVGQCMHECLPSPPSVPSTFGEQAFLERAHRAFGHYLARGCWPVYVARTPPVASTPPGDICISGAPPVPIAGRVWEL